MRLSSLADYAVVLMSAAARHCGSALLAEGKLNASLLSKETGVPLPTAQKLVSRLSAAGLIESTRGIGGGIRLARPPASISLADIIEAVEGPLALTNCTIEGNHDCALEDCCAVRPHWGVVNKVVRGALDGVSLASLVSPPLSPGGRIGMAQPASTQLADAGDAAHRPNPLIPSLKGEGRRSS